MRLVSTGNLQQGQVSLMSPQNQQARVRLQNANLITSVVPTLPAWTEGKLNKLSERAPTRMGDTVALVS